MRYGEGRGGRHRVAPQPEVQIFFNQDFQIKRWSRRFQNEAHSKDVPWSRAFDGLKVRII